MLRRTVRRAVGNTRFSGGKERDRIEQERRRRILYDAAGNLQLGGLLLMMYEDFRKPFAIGVGLLALFYGYNRLLVYLSRQDEEECRRLDLASEQAARQSGKLKADRYLVKPSRQIDDPDFLDIPAYAGKGVNRSKLMSDDAVSGGPMHDERNRS
ncbi:hypothetical protein ABB37_09724 [Leptomonas pyrrhocoris]|uniref:Uncharacterized protein n=1 Tax=Leptomonas pyrrhocoris TaxID=157538 RepID=A0A0N0DQP8_LEPPY|nr:hypothetical protein ABB37_09724 [Leptomonas pyrrhocoris]KPA73592.1 hypothetical protein ABB37_09724 [Leptomonas pyrrhocoris]|eukprot:XP_015652031.1 hypothetical protein ABB37_09724 [Leptomonas pyrrhocoris]